MTTLRYALLLVALAGTLPVAAQADFNVGDRVWHDWDADGIQDPGEPGLAGIEVQLFTGGGSLWGRAFTDADGLYAFADVHAGLYFLRVPLPDGMNLTTQDAGDDDALDSDGFPGSGGTPTFAVDAADDATDWDFGVVATGVGGEVWFDVNANGVQEETALGFPDVAVALLDDAGAIVATTATDAEGRYRFLDLTPTVRYRVRFEVPATWDLSAADAGEDDLVDSDPDPLTGTTPLFELVDPEDLRRWDAGIVAVAIGDRVWDDWDADGVQDEGEPGLAGVELRLTIDGGDVTSTTTAVDGSYAFTGLSAFGFHEIAVLPGNDRIPTLPDAQGDTADSDVGDDGMVDLVFPLDVAAALHTDVGLVAVGSVLGGAAWLDADADGVLDPAEAGLAGVRVELQDAAGAVLQVITTRGDGRYRFGGASPGTPYRLRFEAPPGMHFTLRDQGPDGFDSDVDPVTGETALFAIEGAADADRWGAGLVRTGTIPTEIGGTVWLDRHGDGEQRFDPPLAGVRIELLDEAGVVLAEDTSSDSGRYHFGDLTPYFVYRLRFELPEGFVFTIPDASGDTSDSDVDPATGESPPIPLNSSDDRFRWDAGLVTLLAHGSPIGDRVWEDLDENGIQDPGEPGLAGVAIEVQRKFLVGETFEIIETVVSDTDGGWAFPVTLPGSTYRLRAVLPFDMRPVASDQGEDDLVDSDFWLGTGMTEPFVFAWPEDPVRWDLGIRRGDLAVGGRAWQDADGNGVQDDGENGITGVWVELIGPDGYLDATPTGADGSYAFDRRFPGDLVRLRFHAPAGFEETAIDAAHDEIDSDADPSTGWTTWFLIGPDDAGRWDVGYVPLVGSIGDRVWKDANGNGLQDPREPGVEGVQVALVRSTGTVIEFRETDRFGGYHFAGLYDGPQFVWAFAPAGYAFTGEDAGDDERDSDVDPETGRGPVFTPDGANDARRWDAGLVHNCAFPDASLALAAVSRGHTGDVTFDLIDSNDPGDVSGYRVRRHGDVTESIHGWPVIGDALPSLMWTDNAVPPAGAILFYQFSALNDACGAEGPW